MSHRIELTVSNPLSFIDKAQIRSALAYDPALTQGEPRVFLIVFPLPNHEDMSREDVEKKSREAADEVLAELNAVTANAGWNCRLAEPNDPVAGPAIELWQTSTTHFLEDGAKHRRQYEEEMEGKYSAFFVAERAA